MFPTLYFSWVLRVITVSTVLLCINLSKWLYSAWMKIYNNPRELAKICITYYIYSIHKYTYMFVRKDIYFRLAAFRCARCCGFALRSTRLIYWASTETLKIPHRRGPSWNRRWPAKLRGSRVFFSKVYLVFRLLVPDTACGFCRFKSNMPPNIKGVVGSNPTCNNTLCDPQKYVVSLNVLCVNCMYVCKSCLWHNKNLNS